MAKFQTKDWVGSILFLIAIFLMSYNFFNTESGPNSTTINRLSWVMFIIANLYMIIINVHKIKSKEEPPNE